MFSYLLTDLSVLSGKIKICVEMPVNFSVLWLYNEKV